MDALRTMRHKKSNFTPIYIEKNFRKPPRGASSGSFIYPATLCNLLAFKRLNARGVRYFVLSLASRTQNPNFYLT